MQIFQRFLSAIPFTSLVLSSAFCMMPYPANSADRQREDELLRATLQPVGRFLVANPTLDLGELIQGSSVEVKFPYRVEGNGPVKILGLHEDCGCLSTSLKPGQYLENSTSGEITVQLDTKAFAGPIDKTILVMTDEPQNRRMTRLRIRAKIRQMVALSPPLVRFDFSRNPSPEALVSLKRLAGQTLNIEKLDFNKDNLDVDVEPVRDEWQVRIRWKGEVPVQPFQEFIRISADPPYGQLQIPVLGHVGEIR